MEIREGIKYTYGTENKIAEVFKSKYKKNYFYGNFKDTNSNSGNYHINDWIKDFKSAKIILVEYPYQVGDWVLDINDYFVENERTPKICQITRIGFYKIYVNNENYGLDFKEFNHCYRPCYKEEIFNNSKKELFINLRLLTILKFINNYGKTI